ncbi:MAG: hypothetical protein ABFR33_03855, partial [Verrucomicrobiota bacterium]
MEGQAPVVFLRGIHWPASVSFPEKLRHWLADHLCHAAGHGALLGFGIGGYRVAPFGNAIIWIQLLMVVAIILLLIPRIAARDTALVLEAPVFSLALNMASLAAGIGVVSIEILRMPADWADMAVT